MNKLSKDTVEQAELEIGSYQEYVDIFADFYPEEDIPAETALRLRRLMVERSASPKGSGP